MPITINTNVSAMSAQRNLAASSAKSSSSLNKLSSGSRVPTAREDAASLSVGTGLQLDVAALRAAQVNAQQATTMLQIADGAFGQIADILTRMKSLATTAQSEQLSPTELGFLNTEYQQLISEIDRIAGATEFNGRQLLGGQNTLQLNTATLGSTVNADDGFVGFEFDATKVATTDTFEASFDNGTGVLTITKNDGASITDSQSITVAIPTAGTLTAYDFNDIGVKITLNDQFNNAGADFNTVGAADANFQFQAAAGTSVAAQTVNFQVGINSGDTVAVSIATGNFSDLIGGGAPTAISTVLGAQSATGEIDTAVQNLNTARSTLGATMNRLDFASSNLAVSIENTESARSILMDVDVSAEMTTFTSQQVLIQAGVSMLAQANQQPSLLLQLLQ